MKFFNKVASVSLLLLCCFCAHAQNTHYLIEAEDFQFKGGWVVEESSECFSNSMLRVFHELDNTRNREALSVVNIKPGAYTVWVRSFDYIQIPGTRLFQLIIGETPMKESGKHGHNGFYWENVGQVSLQNEQVLLKLLDTGRYYGRCDAIAFISDATINPNEMEKTEIEKWRRKTERMRTSIENRFAETEKPENNILLKVWLPKNGNINNADFAGSLVSLYGMHYTVNDGVSWNIFSTMTGKEETKLSPSYTMHSHDGDTYLEWDVTRFIESRKKAADAADIQFRLDLEASNNNAMVNLTALRYENTGEYNLYFPFLEVSNDSTPTAMTRTTKPDEDTIYIFPTRTSSVLNISKVVRSVLIYNVSGMLVKQKNDTNTVSVSDLPQGIYYVKTEETTNKFIKL